MAKSTYPTSSTGYYKVTLGKPVDLNDFRYKPSASHTVDQATLDALIAADADAVLNVVAAD